MASPKRCRMPSGTRPVSPVPGLSELTSREREVVGLVASGLSNDEIAARIYVSHSTVKTHVAHAMTKLSARDRAKLVVIAYEAALVRPGWAKIELSPPCAGHGFPEMFQFSCESQQAGRRRAAEGDDQAGR